MASISPRRKIKGVKIEKESSTQLAIGAGKALFALMQQFQPNFNRL